MSLLPVSITDSTLSSILKILQSYEPVLYTRLQSLDIPPQVYGLFVLLSKDQI